MASKIYEKLLEHDKKLAEHDKRFDQLEDKIVQIGVLVEHGNDKMDKVMDLVTHNSDRPNPRK